MKKTIILSMIYFLVFAIAAFKPVDQKYVSSKTHIRFFSHTPAEDIEANNYKTVSTIDPATGDIVFSVPMQSFEFEKSLMQKHFNQKDFLDTKNHPKAKLKGSITNLDEINLRQDGTYNAKITGDLTIRGISKTYNETGTIIVTGNTLKVNSTFNVTLADHEIAFEKGKPSTNVAKTVEVTLVSEYQIQ